MTKYRESKAANTSKTYDRNEIEASTGNIYEALSIIAKQAPLSKAFFAYLLPSNFFPFKAKKIQLNLICLESVDIPDEFKNILCISLILTTKKTPINWGFN